MINWTRFVEVVRAAKSFVLVSHIRPDCDALGSELGMAGVLEALGKQVTICNGQSTPPNLAFIDPAKKVRAINVDLKPEQLQGTDVIMILDTSAWAQLGPMSDVIRASTAKKIVLDHHMSEDDLGAEQFKDVTA
jgi:phosphoesterase RecJ-like protein